MREYAERYASWVCSRHQSKSLCYNCRRNTEPAVFRTPLEVLYIYIYIAYVNEELANLNWERESERMKKKPQPSCNFYYHSGSSDILKED